VSEDDDMTDAVVAFEEFRDRVAAARMARMPELMARMRLDAARLHALQTRRLRELLEHAGGHSPFWKRRLDGVDPTRVRLEQLADVPPVGKADLMREFDDAVTDRRLSRRLVEEALAGTTALPVPLLGRYLAQATGGSSGVRGIFVNDVEAYVEVSGAPLRALLSLGAAGGVPPQGLRLAVVAAATAVHSTALAVAMSKPGAGPIDLHAVPVTLPLHDMVARLSAVRPHVVLGYPSIVARLADAHAAGRLGIRPEAVVTTSETLTDELRTRIRAGFDAPIVDLFGST